MHPLSLQLWTLNENIAKDFAGTIKEVAQIGFKAVELVGTGNLNPAEAARALQDAGLEVSSMHLSWDWFTGKYGEVLEQARLFQTSELVLPGVDPTRYESKEACLAFGAELGKIGARLRADGCRLSYHNHDKEFKLHDGRPGMEWILEAAAPQDLAAQVDLFWAAAAGVDPLRAVQRLGARVRSIHVKDGTGYRQSDIGRGAVDFASIFSYLEKTGLANWYIVEQEEFPGTRLESVRAAYTYLKGLGKS